MSNMLDMYIQPGVAAQRANFDLEMGNALLCVDNAY
jgi:hypothetical protein